MSDTPQTDAELSKELRGLVNWILEHFEYPGNWPLSDESRITFARSAFGRAKTIRESESFLRAEVLAAAAKLNNLKP